MHAAFRGAESLEFIVFSIASVTYRPILIGMDDLIS
jgi:hypothetical protein